MPRAPNAFGLIPLRHAATHHRALAYAKWQATPQGRLARFLDTLTMEFALRAAGMSPKKAERRAAAPDPPL